MNLICKFIVVAFPLGVHANTRSSLISVCSMKSMKNAREWIFGVFRRFHRPSIEINRNECRSLNSVSFQMSNFPHHSHMHTIQLAECIDQFCHSRCFSSRWNIFISSFNFNFEKKVKYILKCCFLSQYFDHVISNRFGFCTFIERQHCQRFERSIYFDILLLLSCAICRLTLCHFSYIFRVRLLGWWRWFPKKWKKKRNNCKVNIKWITWNFNTHETFLKANPFCHRFSFSFSIWRQFLHHISLTFPFYFLSFYRLLPDDRHDEKLKRKSVPRSPCERIINRTSARTWKGLMQRTMHRLST